MISTILFIVFWVFAAIALLSPEPSPLRRNSSVVMLGLIGLLGWIVLNGKF